jgi:3-oxoacyl-[acyl-carrier protein] reductase
MVGLGMKLTLTGKKAIVGGGSRGIGRAIADAFAEAGGDVAICARSEHGLRVAEAELRQHGGLAFGVLCDLGDPLAPTQFVERAASALGGIDILVNNVSGLGLGDDENGWLTNINLDLLATVRATRAATPFIEKAGGGAIINICPSLDSKECRGRCHMPPSRRP